MVEELTAQIIVGDELMTDTQTIEQIEAQVSELLKLKEQKLEASKAVDLETVRKLCKQHGFTATQLRGCLKIKGKGKPKATSDKAAAKKIAAKKAPAKK
jgi:PIN domain nuclease of toxin-antitoxin system